MAGPWEKYQASDEQPVAQQGPWTRFQTPIEKPVVLTEKPYDPEEYEGVAQEFFEGVASGTTKLAQGVAETLALAPDYLLDTNYGPEITKLFEEARAAAGIDPRGLAGGLAEVGVQFVLPASLAAKAVGAISKSGKVGTFLKKFGAGVAADYVVSTNDTTTLGDFFEGGPTQREGDIGLQGDEEAARRALDKLKVAVEGGAATIAGPIIARGLAKGAGSAALAIDQVPGLRRVGPVAVARGANEILKEMGKRSAALEQSIRMGENVSPFKRAVGESLAALRYRGMLPEEAAEARSLITGLTEAEVNKAMATAESLDGKIDDVLSKVNKSTATDTPFTKVDVLNSIDKFLTTSSRVLKNKALQNIPKPLRRDLVSMRQQIDQMSKAILNSDYIRQFGGVVPTGSKQTIEETLRSNLGSYMRRRYRVFEDANYKPSNEIMETAILGFQKDQEATEKLFSEMLARGTFTPEQLGRNVDDLGRIAGPISRDQAKLAADEFLRRYKMRALPKGLSRVAEYRLPTDLFISRTNLRDYQRALLGEVKNPLENYVATVADMAEFKAVDNYFSALRNMADQNPTGMGRLFRDTSSLSPEQKNVLREEGFRILGEGDDPLKSGWGSLSGYAVPDRVYKDLSRSVVGDVGAVGNAARSLYSSFLRLKGATQYGKTVLSPVTQVRNVSTASLFAAMQGNVGRGANLWESLRLVYDNLPEGQFTEDFLELQRLGIVGTQAQLRELQNLISKGFGYTQEASIQGLPTTRRFGSSLTDNPIGKFVSKAGKKAEALYQAGDDVWKIFNFQFEKSKLANAFKRMSDDELSNYLMRKTGSVPEDIQAFRTSGMSDFIRNEAARVVRNTVPNYNLAPESIKFLRKLPVGNFTAFPYEVIRTGINTVARGIDELADPSRAIQEIGMRRLVGVMGTVGTLGPALSKLGYETSGVSEEEMKAYQRSLAPPWEKNARLIPVGRHEDGTPQYINYSYSNPYDLLERIVTSAINKTEEGKLLGKDGGQIAFEAFSEAFSELVTPFTEEAIITAALRDVLDPNAKTPILRQAGQLVGGRGGQTIEGALIYNPQEDAGTKAAKSFAHVLDALLPSVIPVDVRGGEFEPSRFARAAVNSLGLNEETGISRIDRNKIERDLSKELARAFSGITESESQASIGLRYKGYEFSQARREASNIVNRVARRPNVTREQLLDAYEQANEARFRVLNQFHQLTQDLKRFGLTNKDIAKILSRAKIGGYEAILKGRYEPLEISDAVLETMQENGTLDQYPRQEIRDIIKQQRNRRFGAAMEQEPQQVRPTSASAPWERFQSTQQRAAPAAPVIGSMPAPATPQSSPAPARNAPPNPALLGSDPISQAKNAEIARSLSGQ